MIWISKEKVISKRLSVRQTENLVRLIKNNKTKKIKESNILDLENQLANKIGIATEPMICAIIGCPPKTLVAIPPQIPHNP